MIPGSGESMLEIAGFLASVLMGITLGLIGAGGSILTVPVLVYLFSVPPTTATAYSLFIVGMTALIGAFTYMRRSLVSYRTAFIFSVPTFAGVFIARALIMPRIPAEIGSVGSLLITRDLAIMVLFAVLMLMSSVSMIRKGDGVEGSDPQAPNLMLILIEGFVVGILTGLVGAGGGFLIIPALVVIGGLPMKLAVGTSLLIIALKSLLGFTGDLGHQSVDWFFLLRILLFTVGGIFIGTYVSKFIPGHKLKPVFGWFVLLMGVYVIVRESFDAWAF